MDIFSTAAQLKALELMPREYSFLYDTFVQELAPVEDDVAIYDFKKGERQMAPVVVDNAGGIVMPRGGYETNRIGFCTIAPERVIDIGDISRRYFGEDILGAMTPAQREKKMLVDDLAEMRRAIQRRREWMARQVLQTGKLEVFRYTNEGRDRKTTKYADYGFTNIFTPATPWNQAGATIDADMHEIFDLVYEGLGSVDVIVMAPDVADAMMANGSFFKLYDGVNVNAGEINTRYRGQGVRFLGYNSDGVEMYSFAGKYLDDDGLIKPIMPSGMLIAGSRGCLKGVHGPITQVESNGQDGVHKTYIRKEVPLRISSVDANAIKNRLTSRPTIVPFNVDGWCVANVL